ncbi:hypothetical protein KY343_02390 [Candidatus Woesearchaeota archaeon]|nr:hypothetical protein [Candidatus Woesearchaeota archaeon]
MKEITYETEKIRHVDIERYPDKEEWIAVKGTFEGEKIEGVQYTVKRDRRKLKRFNTLCQLIHYSKDLETGVVSEESVPYDRAFSSLEEAANKADEKLEELVKKNPQKYLGKVVGKVRGEIRIEYTGKIMDLVSAENDYELTKWAGASFYDTCMLLSRCRPELRRQVFDLYLEGEERLGHKLYTNSTILSQPYIRELNLDIDPEKLFEEAMKDGEFGRAHTLAGEFELSPEMRRESTLRMTERALDMRAKGRQYILDFGLLYTFVKEVGFDDPVAKKLAKQWFEDTMDTGWLYEDALEIAEEAGLGEEYIARAKWEMQNPVVKFFLNIGKGAKSLVSKSG